MRRYYSIFAITILLGTLWVASFCYRDINIHFNAKFVFGVTFLLTGPLVIYIRFLLLKDKKNDEYNDLIKEFEYLKRNTLSGILIGIGVASFLVGIAAIVYKPEENVFHEKIFEILTLYFTTITSFLIIRTIFEKAAPITNVETLLLRICDDLEELIKKGKGDVWIVYPATIIGYYREKTNRVSDKHYKKYSTLLHDIAEDPHITSSVVTYDPKYYIPLFDVYIKMITENYDDSNSTVKENKDKEVTECVDEANRKYTDFNAIHRNSKAYGIEPGDLKEHFVIVGDVVYTITSFGLPINEKDANGNVVFKKPDFIDSNDKEKLAKLYAYRQQDKELADLIKKKIEKPLQKTTTKII